MKIGSVIKVVLLFIILFTHACGEKVPQKLGVFANTDKGLIELSVYGTQISPSSYELKASKDEVPIINTKMRSFLVNMPNVDIMGSQVYVVYSHAFYNNVTFSDVFFRYQKTIFYPQQHILLKSEIQNIKNNIYKITCLEMKNDADAYKFVSFILKVRMPLGTPDRIYPIRIDRQ